MLPTTISFILALLKTLFRVVMTQKMMIRLMIVLGDHLVNAKKNGLDDKMWPPIKAELEKLV